LQSLHLFSKLYLFHSVRRSKGAAMPSKKIEQALELRAGDIVFYSSSHPSSWLNKWGQTVLHRERVDTTHAAIALAPHLILEANPKGLEENAKGVAEETKLTYPDDFEKIRYVFRNPDAHDVADAIANAAIFFRGEKYDFLKIFTSQLVQPLRKTRGAQQYGKTFCSALVQGVAEKCNLIPPHPSGKLLSPHGLVKYLTALGWEQIEGSRFVRSVAEEGGKKRVLQQLVDAGLDSELVDRADKLDETFSDRLKDLMSAAAPLLKDTVPLLTSQHRLLAERLELDSILKQVHPDRHEALTRAREWYSDQPNFLRKVAAHAPRVYAFPFDLLNLTPFVLHLASIRTVVSKAGHYSVANEIKNLEKMNRETIKWIIDEVKSSEQEARTQITETKFYEVYDLYLSDSIQERMEHDIKLRNAMTQWENGTDRIATLTSQSALAHGLSLSKAREKLLELKQLCSSVVADEDLRSRLEILLAEREKYVGLIEDWPKLRSAEADDLSDGVDDDGEGPEDD
jgi:hypothetical protein